ncbi:MAG TPA: NAD(P)H-binding protein [Chitinophaga sp.]|nr:NAD(P)H-binding protein [Chitinophaga sp.]
MEKQILVLGANGKTGSRVTAKLAALNLPVRKGSRNGIPRFDWDDKGTWEPALKDIHSVYITFQPDLAAPGSLEAIETLSRLAAEAGVKKLVLLSGRGEKEAQDCEKIVMNSGLQWTIVRASWFNQNFSESYLLEPIQAGFVALPAGDVKEPFIDVDDIADVVVAALTEEGHNEKVYEVTGPRALSFREAINEIAQATGKPVQYEQIPAADYIATLKEYQVPQDVINLLNYLFSEILDGRNTIVSHGVEQALGRKPKDFSTYVKEVSANGTWANA